MPESPDDLRTALAAAQVGVWWWDIASNTIGWSREMADIFGLEPARCPRSLEDYTALVAEADREAVAATINQALRLAAERRQAVDYVIEHRLILAEGRVRWISGRGRVLLDDQGKPCRLTGTAIDISLQKETEASLRRSEEAHRLFSELASDYIYVSNFGSPALVPEIVAGSFERTTGLSVREVEARGGWWNMLHPDDRERLSPIVPILAAGKHCVTEYRIVNGAGHVRWLRDSIQPIKDPETGQVTKLMGGVQDITDKRRLEEELLVARKLEAVARLAGGVAHDFNNLLSVVMGAAGLLEYENLSPDGSESLSAILEAAKRGAELTNALLAFARRDAGSNQVTDLNTVVRETAAMLRRAVGPRVVVSIVPFETPCLVKLDPGQAQLVLLNLVVNARDAMPAGGNVEISVEAAEIREGDQRLGELTPGRYIALSVRDEGTGIAPEVRTRLFEPFFTTKPVGKGTGLGLSACHGIVRAAGGAIQVENGAKQGCTFRLFFPVAHAEKSEQVRDAGQHASAVASTILLVEDEPALRRALTRTLQDAGYRVIDVGSAEDALSLLEEGVEVSLLISDVILPGLPGTELVALALAERPALTALLISGNPGTAVIPEGVPLLPKPFTGAQLATCVRDMLVGAGSAAS